MKKENSYTHIFKYTSLFGSIQGLNILIGLIRNKIIAVLLGPAGVGLISIYNTASVLLQNSTNFGIQISGVREMSGFFERSDQEGLNRSIRIVRTWSFLAAVLGFLACMLLSSRLSQWAFSSNDYTTEFMLLSPVVFMAAISGGETAILKATRRLGELAKISVAGVMGALVVSLPLYIEWGNDGIVPSLILIAIVQMLLVVTCSFRHYPYCLRWNMSEILAGRQMLILGVAFVAAGIFGSGADFLVRTFLSDISVSLAGLYNAGYMITMTYSGMVFAAMETDYYPHLSAVSDDVRKISGAANRQIEVSMMMVAPMLVGLMVVMPMVIPLLFTSQFLPVVGMTQVALVAMYFRCVNLPVAYIMLAKGDSRSYMLMEFIYNALIVPAAIIGYHNWGLAGTGLALAVTGLIDCLCVIGWCSWKYGFIFSSKLLTFVLMQIFIGLLALFVVWQTTGWLYCLLGGCAVVASCALSWMKFRKRMNG